MKRLFLIFFFALFFTVVAQADGLRDFQKARRSFENNDYQKAIEYYVLALKDKRFIAGDKALMGIADSHFADEDHYQASFYYNRLLSEFPGSSLEADARDKKRLAQNKLNEKTAAQKKLAGLHGYKKARSLARRGKYEKAIILMQRFVRKYPKSDLVPRALYYLGYYCELYDSPIAATKHYNRLFEEFPESSLVDNALYRMGRIYYREGETKKAERIFSQAYTVHNGDSTPKCLYWWAKLTESDNVEEALNIYTYVAERFDHTYSAYKSRQRLNELGYEPENIKAYGIDMVSLDPKLAKAKKLYDSGNFKKSISLVERKVKGSILDGSHRDTPKQVWELTYPRGFWDYVNYFSITHDVDPYLTLAVIREESRFHPEARSRSWARGLMQIIGSTGRILCKAKKLGYSNAKMYDVETNINLGTYYLGGLIDRFDGSVEMALAGYNGGPARVAKWKKAFYNGDIDDFIIRIPIRETREYVQKVLASYYEYKRLYGKPRE